MPLVRVTIDAVHVFDAETGRKFLIDAHEGDLPRQFHCWNAWHASLCKRAAERGNEVNLIWKDGSPKRWGGRFPKEVVGVEIAS